MNRMLKVLIVAAGFGLLPAAATADTYLLIPGVTGDATDPAHSKWIRVSDLAWGANMPATSGTSGGGATVGKATAERIKLTIPTGTWSRELLNNLARGIVIPQLVIDHVNPDGRPAFRVTIGSALITKYVNAPAAKEPALDEIEVMIGSYKTDFYTVAADGRVTTATAGWNFITNTPIL